MGHMSSYHVEVAAEAFAVGAFAQAGFDVSVRYGANQPDYDFVAADQSHLIKVSVKGSQKGEWTLAPGHVRAADYHAAAEAWLSRQAKGVLLCLVQFKNVRLGECPRIYLATPREVADCLKNARNGHGATKLREDHAWSARSAGAGTTDRIPRSWLLSRERIKALIG